MRRDGLTFDPGDAGEALCIDGAPLSSAGCWLSSAEIGEAAPALAISEVPGRPGGIDRTLELADGSAVPGRRACSFTIATSHPTRAMLWLGRLAGRVVEVFYETLGFSLRGRLSVGQWDLGGISTVALALDAEPYGLGIEQASGGRRVFIEGSAPVEPVFEVRVETARPRVELKVDGRGVMRVASAAGGWKPGAVIAIDSAGRTVRAGGNLVAPTLDSDWPVLDPGQHEIACEGCEVKTSWRERFMF
mgnify:FL=1